MFVAVYQKSLSLMYIPELLAAVKTEFAAIYQPRYPPNACRVGRIKERVIMNCKPAGS